MVSKDICWDEFVEIKISNNSQYYFIILNACI